MTSSPGPQIRASKGFALIITLIMVTLAAVIVIALLNNATLERSTSKSVTDRLKAEQAAANALEMAKKALAASPAAGPISVTSDDGFLVVKVDAPAVPTVPPPAVPTTSYYFLAKAQSGPANKIDYYPLFAGGAPTLGQPVDLAAGAAPPAVTRPTPPANPNPAAGATAAIETDSAQTKILSAYPAVAPWLGPPSTEWIETRDPNDTATSPAHDLPYQRFTFWIEDLSGYLDGSVVGNTTGPGATHQRGNGTSPSEIGLFAIFDPNVRGDSGQTAANELISQRHLLLTVPSIKLVASNSSAPPPPGPTDPSQRYLAVRLGLDEGG